PWRRCCPRHPDTYTLESWFTINTGQYSGHAVGPGAEGAGSVGTPAATAGASADFLTIRTSRQHFVLDSGRVSMISTVSPTCDSLFSSWTWQIVRRLMYLP